MTEKWEEEMDFVDKLLNDDIRNNSAWNQRWFVVHRGSKSTPIPLEVAREEIKFSISKACLDPYNESAWRYFVAFVKEQLQAIGKTSEFTEFLESCQDAITDTKKIFEEESKKDGMECIHMIAAYIDILEMKGDAQSLSNAQKLAEELGDRYDTVRRTYWMLRSKQLKSN
jgi:protein farnesyltransferase/geranylgeranyltransferase type-1 subunit alpha